MIQPRNVIDLRTRLIERNRSRHQEATWQRIQEAERDRQAALLRRAHAEQMSAEPDEIKPGSWVTRFVVYERDQRTQYGINLTSLTGCTCSEWRIWHRCPCQAFVLDLETAIQEIAA